MSPATSPFVLLGCDLCNGKCCRLCDPLGTDRAAHSEYLEQLAHASPDRARELRQAGDYYRAHRWEDAR